MRPSIRPQMLLLL